MSAEPSYYALAHCVDGHPVIVDPLAWVVAQKDRGMWVTVEPACWDCPTCLRAIVLPAGMEAVE